MKNLIVMIGLLTVLQANSLGVIDDAIRGGKSIGMASHMDDAAILLKAEKLSQVTYAALKFNKSEKNIEALLRMAVKEHRLQHYYDQFTYIDKYKKFKNGDRLLLDCLQNPSCDIAKYTKTVENTYVADKVTSGIYTIKGFWNDVKIHHFIDGNGQILKAKISEVVDLNRVVRMPYIGSIYKNANAAGFKRDAAEFWSKYKDMYPEVLSQNNLNRINSKPNPLSPIVDEQWIKYNPNHRTFKGEILEHHHLNNTDITVGIPKSLHRGRNNKELMHVD